MGADPVFQPLGPGDLGIGKPLILYAAVKFQYRQNKNNTFSYSNHHGSTERLPATVRLRIPDFE